MQPVSFELCIFASHFMCNASVIDFYFFFTCAQAIGRGTSHNLRRVFFTCAQAIGRVCVGFFFFFFFFFTRAQAIGRGHGS